MCSSDLNMLRELGKHPADEKPVRVMMGRYGPYVNHGRLNASLPKNTAPDNITLEQAVELLEKKKAKKATKQSARKKK